MAREELLFLCDIKCFLFFLRNMVIMNIQNEIHPLACAARVRSRGQRRALTSEAQGFIISYKFLSPLMLQRSNYQRGKQTHTFFSLPRQLRKCVFYVVNLEVSVSPWLDTVFIQDFLDLMFKTAWNRCYKWRIISHHSSRNFFKYSSFSGSSRILFTQI